MMSTQRMPHSEFAFGRSCSSEPACRNACQRASQHIGHTFISRCSCGLQDPRPEEARTSDPLPFWKGGEDGLPVAALTVPFQQIVAGRTCPLLSRAKHSDPSNERSKVPCGFGECMLIHPPYTCIEFSHSLSLPLAYQQAVNQLLDDRQLSLRIGRCSPNEHEYA